MKKLALKLGSFAQEYSNEKINAYAAQSSYYIFLSLIPFLIIIVAMLRYIPGVASTVSELLMMLPETTRPLIIQVTSEAFQAGLSLVPVAFIAMLWSASRGIRTVMSSIKHIYKNDKSRNFIKEQLASLIYALLYGAALTITLLVLVFGSTIIDFLTERFPSLSEFTALSAGVRYLLLFCVLTFLFCATFCAASHRQKERLAFFSHMPGSLTAAGGWLIFSLVFAFFVDNFSNYSSVYGSLTAVILLLLWLHACVSILLTGALMNVLLAKRSRSEIELDEPKC